MTTDDLKSDTTDKVARRYEGVYQNKCTVPCCRWWGEEGEKRQSSRLQWSPPRVTGTSSESRQPGSQCATATSQIRPSNKPLGALPGCPRLHEGAGLAGCVEGPGEDKAEGDGDDADADGEWDWSRLHTVGWLRRRARDPR